MVSLIAKLQAMKLTTFSFASFEKKMSSLKEGETERNSYLVLELVDPIDQVIGTNTIYDPNSDRRVPYSATDVIRINVNLKEIEQFESEFTFDENADGTLSGSGKYSGDLFLDVASRSGDVWLTATKFSKMSGDWKKKMRSEKFQHLVEMFDKKSS